MTSKTEANPLSILQRLGIGTAAAMVISLSLADLSIAAP